MAIYTKLLKIQSEVKGLSKDKSAYNYEYVTGDKLLSHIRPMMCEMQLLLLPSIVDVRSQVVTYDVYDKYAKGIISKTEILYIVNMDMKWVDAEDGEVLVERWAGSGMNAFDKGYGSALTYGERYYLLKTFHIPTDKDDVDAIATVRDRQLEETYSAQVREPDPKPISIDILNKYIMGQAEGKFTKSGKTCRQGYIDNYHPTPQLLAQFDEAVAAYKIDNNLA